MAAVIMEGVLVIALVVAAGTLIFFAVTTFTPLGRRWSQRANQGDSAPGVGGPCPIHGDVTREAMVRLPSGETACPKCLAESASRQR